MASSLRTTSLSSRIFLLISSLPVTWSIALHSSSLVTFYRRTRLPRPNRSRRSPVNQNKQVFVSEILENPKFKSKETEKRNPTVIVLIGHRRNPDQRDTKVTGLCVREGALVRISFGKGKSIRISLSNRRQKRLSCSSRNAHTKRLIGLLRGR